MARGEEKVKRGRIWRPRFSVRILVIFVTLVCAYFGLWETTKRYASGQPVETVLLPDGLVLFSTGDDDASDKLREAVEKQSSIVSISNVISPGPLIVARSEINVDFNLETVGQRKRCYYLWLFGPTIKLPFETDS